MDSHDDGGGQWLTYAEIAAARGTSRLAAVRLTQRHRWRRQKGNDGFARVLVPADMLPDDRGDRDRDTDDDTPAPFHARALTALEGAISALQAAHVAEVDALRKLADAASARLVDLDAEAAALRDRLADAEARNDQAVADARDAQQAAEALRAAESARRALGRWRRVLAAWRGR